MYCCCLDISFELGYIIFITECSGNVTNSPTKINGPIFFGGGGVKVHLTYWLWSEENMLIKLRVN